jgi:ATP-dependent protease HslVU (ClpYQ) peptidase subunit
MSIVVAKVVDNKIIFGADSISVAYCTQAKDRFSKLFALNNMIVGTAGFVEESTLFQIFCGSRHPVTPTEKDILDFLCEFAEWKKKKIEKFPLENHYIIGFEGKAFLCEGFLVSQTLKYDAIGAGRDYALSALLLGTTVEKAIETACELSIYCERPVHILEMEGL